MPALRRGVRGPGGTVVTIAPAPSADVIRKARSQWRVRPNVVSYEDARASFTWDAAAADLDGLPAGGGLNIAHNRRRRRRGHRTHRAARHQRGPDPRPRLRRHERRSGHRGQDVRHRPGRRDPARRHAHPRRPGTGRGRPLGSLELVAAPSTGTPAARRAVGCDARGRSRPAARLIALNRVRARVCPNRRSGCDVLLRPPPGGAIDNERSPRDVRRPDRRPAGGPADPPHINDGTREHAPHPRRATARVLQAIAIRLDPAVVREAPSDLSRPRPAEPNEERSQWTTARRDLDPAARRAGCRRSSTAPPGRPRSTSCGSREGAHPRGRRDRRRTPAAADGRGRRRDAADRRERAGHAARRLRGPEAAVRVVPHVARRPPRRGPVRGLHVQQRAGARALLPALARRHLRDVLRGPVRGEQPLPRVHGLGHAVVLRAQDSAERCSPGATSACSCAATCAYGDRVFETYWTTGRGSRSMGPPTGCST